jgi:DNA primase
MAYDVEAIKASHRLSDIAAKHIKLERNGNEWRGCCPFHNEKTPSFTIFVKGAEERFHCFGCGADGDLLGFVQDLYQVDFREACKILGGESDAQAKVVAKEAAPAVDVYANLTALVATIDTDPVIADRAVRVWNPKKADSAGARAPCARRWCAPTIWAPLG